MRLRSLITALLFTISLYAQQEGLLKWPAVTNETKPWTRLWWPGSIGTESDIKTALAEYDKAGFGGSELTVLYGVRGYEDKFVSFLSPEWMKNFLEFVSASKWLGMGIDLANASSWPFGGPWVTPDDASKYVAYKTWKLKAGESVPEKIEYIQEPFIRWNGTYRTEISNLADPITLNKNLQELAIDQVRFEKPLPVHTIMAYSGDGKVLNITENLEKNGILNWSAPEGEWTVYAVFMGWHGKMVERAGPGGEGYVIDHFSGSAIKNYLERFDEAFKGYDLGGLRGFFNDSYEVDDARGQSCWTGDIFTEFRARRGYDLREQLPALFQKDTPEKNARVLCDYRQTISDLILDKFTKTWTGWANKQGKITRNQSHGSPGNILDLYAASDIPETEGTDLLKMKFGTSAANVSGKRLVSAEATTWLGEHFSSTLLDVKKNIDQYFLAGVNHVVYHGTCFSPENEPWPGFLFYAAAEFTPANSFWEDLPVLNKYVTRVQSFLQNSKPDNDVLLYFPIFDRYSDYKNTMLEHFDAISPGFNGSAFRLAADEMLKNGYAFDYISDHQTENLMVEGSLIWSGGVSYKTYILPACKYIPVGTFNRIINLAEKGATVVFLGGMPESFSGYGSMEENAELFRFLKERVVFGTAVDGISKAEIGRGIILSGNDPVKLLEAAKVRNEKMTGQGLKFSRRKTFNNTIYYILNQGDKTFEGWIEPSAKGKYAALFDPMTVTRGIAKTKTEGGRLKVYIKIDPLQSMILLTSETRFAGESFRYFDINGNPIKVEGEWKLSFLKGGPTLPGPVTLKEASPWTEQGNNDILDFSGTAEYMIKFSRPAVKADYWLLDLGKVYESAKVYINDREAGACIGPVNSLVISNTQLKSENELRIRVTNLSANRIAYLDRNKVNWKKFYNTNYPARLPQNRKNGLFDASDWKPRKSGLEGPVTLTPLKPKKF